MLFKETISTQTLELLKRIMADQQFDHFTLVGGTALSLLIGHRISIDLDFFTTRNFDASFFSDYLYANYTFKADYISKNTLKGLSNEIQLDFIAHQYPFLEQPLLKENIRIASLKDIAAMKLNAIATNGSRIKDFTDIAFLSLHLTLNQMLDAYEEKYQANKIIGIKSLSYFNDVNIHEPLKMIKAKQPTWQQIKTHIRKMIEKPDQVFSHL